MKECNVKKGYERVKGENMKEMNMKNKNVKGEDM